MKKRSLSVSHTDKGKETHPSVLAAVHLHLSPPVSCFPSHLAATKIFTIPRTRVRMCKYK